MITILWAFAEKEVDVELIDDKVAYSWTCDDPENHEHTIDCLWIWHDCDRNLDPIRREFTLANYVGWTPTGVGKHDLISTHPLHIEASVYWPSCCGLHGFIRNGQWQGV